MRAFEALGRIGFARLTPAGSPGPVGVPEHAVDCRGGQDWRNLVAPRELYKAWSPPPSSPWSGFARPTLFASLRGAQPGQVFPTPPRLPHAGAFTAKPRLSPGTAVLVDLPGAWSVAVAAWLARWEGLQPVALHNNWPHPLGVVPMAGVLGALLHYAPWVQEGAKERSDRALPVFVLDRNRLAPRMPREGEFDNRYFHVETDFPSPAALKRAGVERLLYVRPGPAEWVPIPDSAATQVPPGPPPVAAQAAQDAMAPWSGGDHDDMDDLNVWLHGVSKAIGLGLATALPTAWGLEGRRDFAPALRKTAFTTVKDPAFAGFRRASVGGFGKLVPEPASGGGGFG